MLELGMLLGGVAEGVLVIAGGGGLHLGDAVDGLACGPGAGDAGSRAKKDGAGEGVGREHYGKPLVQSRMIANGELGAALLHDLHGGRRVEAGFPTAVGGEVLEAGGRIGEAAKRNARGQQGARAGFLEREDVGVAMGDDGGGGGVGVGAVGDEGRDLDLPLLRIGAG